MARSIFVNGWNVPIRLEDFNFIEAARNGEVGTGGFDLDSENAGVTINSHWDVSARETSAPAPNYLYEGYVADLTIARGPFSIDKDRQYDVNIVDLNTLLIDDIITGSSGNRPEETDIARVTWLTGTSFLSGMGATIGGSGSTTLEAADFRTQTPLDLLTQAAETAGKLFFVYWDFVTEAPKLFYDLATASNFITSSKISTYLPDGSNSTTHHPRKATLVRNQDGGRIYSELLFKYDGGSVTVTNAATASNYRARKTVIYDNFVKTEAQANRKANQYLASVSTPEDVITLDVDLTAAQINEFRAGQLMQIKAPHLGLPTFTDRRIVRTERKPREASGPPDQEDYTVTMELSVPKSNKFGSSGVPTDVLPDSVAGGGNTPADTETTGCVTPGAAAALRWYNYGDGGADIKDDLASGSVGSYVWMNIAYTVCGCPIGGGGWHGWKDEELWFPFTAPADNPKYTGLLVTVDGSGATWNGPFESGFVIRAAEGAAGTGSRFGEGAIVGSIQPGESVTVYVPRSHVLWGGVNNVIVGPDWRCGRGVFYCNGVADFSNPVQIGVFASGGADPWSATAACPVQFTAGSTGSSGWVAGLGDTDGANATFTLIDWSAAGTVEASINGLVQPNSEVTLDTGAGTATFSSPPPAGAIVLFLYTVAAA